MAECSLLGWAHVERARSYCRHRSLVFVGNTQTPTCNPPPDRFADSAVPWDRVRRGTEDMGLQPRQRRCAGHPMPERAAKLDQLGTGVALGHALGQQLVKLLARPLRCRYSRGHGDASSCRRRQPATFGLDSGQESASPSRYPAILGFRRSREASALIATCLQRTEDDVLAGAVDE
jgi:hypothetical protein